MVKGYLLPAALLAGGLFGPVHPVPAQSTARQVAVRNGVIDDVRLNEQLIIVNDTRYLLRGAARLRKDPGNLPVPPSALVPGRHVRITVENEGAGRIGQITAVWLLAAPPVPSPE